MTQLTRRTFIKLAATTTAALAAGCAPNAATSTADSSNAGPTAGPATPATRPPVVASPSLDPAPAEIVITDDNDLYVQSYSSIPSVDAATWKLNIDGLVARPLSFTLDDIKALPAVEVMRTLECIGNPLGGPLIGNVVWKGAYLKPLFDQAAIQPSAIRAKFEAGDGYATSIDLKYINVEGAFLAYEMNGEPLTKEHGFPLRVFYPGSYGQKMPKWIERIELIDYEFEGYWEARGWSDVAQIQTNSIIKQPAGLSTFGLELIPIWGVALAASKAITKVEAKIGDGDWTEAALIHGPSNEVWTQWSLDWSPPGPGQYKVQVRATDADGFTQSTTSNSLLGGAFPRGTDAIHQIVVKIKI